MSKRWIRPVVLTGLGVLVALAAAQPSIGGAEPPADIQKSDFGRTADGRKVDLYTLTNGRGLTAKVMTYGITVTELRVPDARGQAADVVLGLDDLKGYLDRDNPNFGAMVGRNASRGGGGQPARDGPAGTPAVKGGPNPVRGAKGFGREVWEAEPTWADLGPGVRFRRRSPDGEGGYPGNLEATVIVSLTKFNELQLVYTATTDKATPVNLSHHFLFNLAGQGAGDVLGQVVEIRADRYAPVDRALVPPGTDKPVAGTPFDFRQPTPIGARIRQAGGNPVGYDVDYALDESTDKDSVPPRAARVRDPKSGRLMEVLTTEPALLFDTGNSLGGVKGKGGAVYNQYAGFCLEAQHFPDADKYPGFPSVTLLPGMTYWQMTVYRFRTQ
jgi:aldose 1-epimerase